METGEPIKGETRVIDGKINREVKEQRMEITTNWLSAKCMSFLWNGVAISVVNIHTDSRQKLFGTWK